MGVYGEKLSDPGAASQKFQNTIDGKCLGLYPEQVFNIDSIGH